VVKGSTSVDLTTAVLDITTQSGTDNVIGYQPLVAFGAAFPLGTRGLTLTITGVTDLVAGDQWSVTVAAQYNVVTCTKDGSATYTGARDTTYILTCTKGGALDGTNATFKVQTSNGYDTGAPIKPVASTNIAIGNYGVRVNFDAEHVRQGPEG
jgi:hypothetical protein